MMYGYARVSAPGQDPAIQVERLTAAGCERIFAEQASAAAGRKRPQLLKLIAALQPGDVFTVTNINRFARSARDALNVIATITGKGAGFKALDQPWADTTTANGRVLITVFSGFAELDREQILQRTAEGRAHAKARGVRMGRRPTLTREQTAFVVRTRSGPPPRMTISQLQELLGVSRSTICRAARTPVDQLADLLRPAPQIDLEELLRDQPTDIGAEERQRRGNGR